MRKVSILAGLLVILLVNIPVSAAGDFTIAATPGLAMITAGGSMTFNVTASPAGGFSGSVNLTASASPPSAEVSISFAKNPLQPYTSYGYNYPDGTTMTVTTTGKAACGFTITVTGSNGPLSHSASVSLQVAASTTTTSTTTTSTTTTSTTTKSTTSSTTTSSSTTTTAMTTSTMTTASSVSSFTTTTSSSTTQSPTSSATATITPTTQQNLPQNASSSPSLALVGAGGVALVLAAVAIALVRRRGSAV